MNAVVQHQPPVAAHDRRRAATNFEPLPLFRRAGQSMMCGKERPFPSLAEGRRRLISQRRVRAFLVVVGDPFRELRPCMRETEEQGFVEKLVAHTPVEALTKTVLNRLPRRDEMPSQCVILRPGEHGGLPPCEEDAGMTAVRKERPFPPGRPTGQIDVKRSCKPLFVSRSWKILAVAPSANNRGLIVFEMAESPRRDDPQRNAGSGSYCRSP